MAVPWDGGAVASARWRAVQGMVEHRNGRLDRTEGVRPRACGGDAMGWGCGTTRRACGGDRELRAVGGSGVTAGCYR